ncbi:hypothetical protein ACFCYB_27425 [Streptomyces sp. NPDC056309]|uniref:hypothetical protein n=1 Tax=unclassified Streptomyces TaxID=2593676 RepID=UPI0035E31B5B
MALASGIADESSQITQDHGGDLHTDGLAVLRTPQGPRDSGVLQLGLLSLSECCGQARRDREDDAPVVLLTGDETRLAGFDEFLDAAAGKKALPLSLALTAYLLRKRLGPHRRRRPAPHLRENVLTAWPTAVALTAGTLATTLGYLLLARLMKVTELRRLPGMR